jgi:hypothetical protein
MIQIKYDRIFRFLFQTHDPRAIEDKISPAFLYVGTVDLHEIHRNSQLYTRLQFTEAKEGNIWFLVNSNTSRPHNQNTTVVMETAQVSDMWSHTICKELENSNKVDLNGICAVFM